MEKIDELPQRGFAKRSFKFTRCVELVLEGDLKTSLLQRANKNINKETKKQVVLFFMKTFFVHSKPFRWFRSYYTYVVKPMTVQ